MNAIVTEARRWIGTPYVHQGSLCGAGSDCLGLIRGIYRATLGAEPEAVPPYAPDWADTAGGEVLLKAAPRWLSRLPDGPADPGNVLMFRMRDRGTVRHLGIFCGHDRFIHAYSGHGVTESPLSTPWTRRIAARFAFPERI